ncbi:hypothetical protein LP421_04835 (plasmid) [Rhizobium sp. RCAM05350]|nr:hypothetical protein LP421_04835 [Rhizobium sp. RCAM05350]
MTITVRSSDRSHNALKRDFDRVNRHRALRAFLVPLLTLVLICGAIAWLQPRFLSWRACKFGAHGCRAHASPGRGSFTGDPDGRH